MKRIMLFCLMVAMGLPLLAWAEDGNNVSDQLGDIFSGKGQTYGGVEVIKDIKLPISIIGIDKIGFNVWAETIIGKIDAGVKRDVRGGIRLRIIL